MYGARAVLKNAVRKYGGRDVDVHVVWLPMVEGDNETAARKTGAMFPANRARQYFDADRAVGLAMSREAFAGCLDQALSGLPEDHPLYPQLHEWSRIPQDEKPLWDAVLFYPQGDTWEEKAPIPLYWSKQVGFYEGRNDGVTGTFFKNDCRVPPVDSDWFDEVEEQLEKLLRKRD